MLGQLAQRSQRHHPWPMTISIVTGANRGIGLALVAELSKRGAVVLAACRKSSPELAALGVEIVEGVDVNSEDGVALLVEAVQGRKIELLINNAGILLWGDSLEEPNFTGMTQQFEVNAVGPIRVTSALKSQFIASTKLAFVTSRMGSIADNGSGGHYGYRMSKAALNIAAVSIARDLKPQGIPVVILHPGMVKTDMIGGRGQVEPEEAAHGLLARIDGLTLEQSGAFFHQNGEELPW